MGEKQRVLVTGASGVIGTAVREYLGDRYDLHALTHRPADFPSHVADVADLEAILPAFAGIDAVVHLAASASVAAPWNDVLHNNLIGTYNVFEASRRRGVKAVVFASSNHAIGGYEIDGAPGIYAPDDPRVYDRAAELRPDSLYGVSKAYGEALGRYYHDRFGLRVCNLRIGSVLADDDPRADSVRDGSFWLDITPEQKYDRMRATWLSRRDCAGLIAACLDAEDVGWAVVYGISDNPRQFWDLTHGKEVLGWWPMDRAPE
ncbi:MAG TPA: NAD(P)-dependent oxidoreductase [Thermomicrobiales bacterium]|jgi:nucleoside-diphosphate-sugar epimerase